LDTAAELGKRFTDKNFVRIFQQFAKLIKASLVLYHLSAQAEDDGIRAVCEALDEYGTHIIF
jgi:hypothetical protein